MASTQTQQAARSLTVHVLQMTSHESPQHNLDFIRQQLQQLGCTAAQALVVLPEACLHFGQGQAWSQAAELSGQGYFQQQLAQLARQYGCYLVAGTLPIAAQDGRAYASSWLFGPNGDGLGRYDKVHLFDAQIHDGITYQERLDTCPGEHCLVVDCAVGRIGLAVCYDVRFPLLFAQLAAAGADIIVLPAAFTARTGAAHWQPLLQARAIENQIFIAAANQWGQHADGRQTWGHSMIVDPWGSILAQQASGSGWVSAHLDLTQQWQIRADMPVLSHRRTVTLERTKEGS
ncbi:MAG: carbon-nitrogen hydrolase family protein [Ferrimonas sp.]